jgi:hypothetical protein
MWLHSLIERALAYDPKTLPVYSPEPGANISLGQMVINVTDMIGQSIIYIASAVFVYGALLYIFSAVREDSKNDGKQYMVGALIGFFIVYSAKWILNMVMAFIYSTN